MLRARASTISGWSSPTAAVRTTSSTPSERWASSWPTIAPGKEQGWMSQPVTASPRTTRILATPLIPMPPMPTKWIFTESQKSQISTSKSQQNPNSQISTHSPSPLSLGEQVGRQGWRLGFGFWNFPLPKQSVSSFQRPMNQAGYIPQDRPRRIRPGERLEVTPHGIENRIPIRKLLKNIRKRALRAVPLFDEDRPARLRDRPRVLPLVIPGGARDRDEHRRHFERRHLR